MEITIYNFLKQRLETIDLQISEENATWFEDESDDHDIYMITDFDGGLLISPRGYDNPLWIDGTSRAAIDYSSQKALALKAFYIEEVNATCWSCPSKNAKHDVSDVSNGFYVNRVCRLKRGWIHLT